VKRLEGVITWFDQERGFGWVDVQGEKYFLHVTQLPGNCDQERLIGKVIAFTPAMSHRGPNAYNVVFLGREEEE
jgi:cold shock CspA family protein